MPAPRLLTRLPDASNFTSGATVGDFSHVVEPHRSNAQRLRPSRSMSMPAVEPMLRPCGILKKPSTWRYGLG